MEKVVLAADFAAKIRDKLLTQQTMLKAAETRVNETMEKLAVTQRENDVLRAVLQLVTDGVVDPTEAMTKAAEFLGDPMRFQVEKAAHELGIDRFDARLGTPAAEPGPLQGENPIEECLVRLVDQGLIG